MESEGKQLPFGDDGDMDEGPTGSGTFAELLQQAAKLKEAQMATDRRKYDAWPDYYKASLFPGAEVEKARELPFQQRLDKARALHDQGLQQLTSSSSEGPIKLLGQALAVFRYIHTTDPHIRDKGIRDESLVPRDYVLEGGEGVGEVKALLVDCYTHLAHAYLRSKQRAWCVCACDEALTLDPEAVPALVLRARARSSALSASQRELKLALTDLYSATQKDKNNTAVRMEYKRLWHDVMEGEKKDKATFQGMFDRGSISDDRRHDTHKDSGVAASPPEPSSRRRKRPAPNGGQVVTGLATPPPPLHRRPPVTEEGHSHHNCCTHNRSTSATSATNAEGSKKRPARQEEEDEEGEEGGAPMTMKEFLTQMDRLETLAKEHDSEGRVEEAEEVRRTIAECREWLVQERKAAAANKFGLDLDDPRVQDCLDRLARGEALPDDEGGLVGGGLGWLCWGVALSVLLVLVLVLWMGGEGAGAHTSATSPGAGLMGGAKGGGSAWEDNEFDEF